MNMETIQNVNVFFDIGAMILKFGVLYDERVYNTSVQIAHDNFASVGVLAALSCLSMK